MKQGVKIILLTLLLGVIWVTGLTNADIHNSDTVENYCISNYTQAESFEEYLHDANDNSQLHISNQRRTNSSSQSRSFKKNHRRSSHTKTSCFSIAFNQTLDRDQLSSYLANCGWRQLTSRFGCTLIARLHQFRI